MQKKKQQPNRPFARRSASRLAAAFAVALMGGGVIAADFPSVVNGTLTLDVAGGERVVYPDVLPDTVNTLTKKGWGHAILSGSPMTAFPGSLVIEGGALELLGSVTAGSVTRWSWGDLYLNGPLTLDKFEGKGGGLHVCSSNVTRRIKALKLNETDARLELSDGLLDVDWMRLGNSGKRNTLVQSGGALVLRDNEYGTCVGESGVNSYGAYLMTGGTATFSNAVNITTGTGAEGLVWQSGGTFRTRGNGTVLLGQGGRGFLGVFDGATNDTRNAQNGDSGRLRLGSKADGVATLAVSGVGSVLDTEALIMGANGIASTNLVAVTDGGALKARRLYRASTVAAAALNEVYVDGGTVMPTFAWGWTATDATDATRRPDFWTIGPRGMVIDTSELGTTAYDSDWAHAFSDATGRGIAEIALPTEDAEFAAEKYRGPVFVEIEGPADSHGAAAVAAFDPATRKLTRIVVVAPGSGYDETTRVYVRSAAATGRHECAYTLTGARAGGRLTKRGAGTLALYAANTYTGGTVVESGTLVMTGENSFPANTPLKVMDGAVFKNKGRALAVSVLGGAGGTVTDCAAVSVSEALEITADELFAASGPLTVAAAVDFAEGVVVRVTDPENLPKYAQERARPFLKATDGFTGAVPAMSLDGTAKGWKVTVRKNVLRFGPERGMAIILR